MRHNVDTHRSVSDAHVTTFTTSPVCGASITRPWPTNIATNPAEAGVPALEIHATLAPMAPREEQCRLRGVLRGAGHISLSLLYLPCFAAVLAAERPSPFLVRASDAETRSG